MITPRFRLEQDEQFLYIMIHAPFSRVSDADIFMDGSDFRFHSNPYYLRLTLTGDVVENDEAEAKFDSETNEFKITCPKVNKGTHFPRLDMLTSLLEPKGKRNIDEPFIEVISNQSNDKVNPPSSKLEPDFDWFIEQKPDICQDVPSDKENIKYGFGMQYSKVFTKLVDELHGVLDINNPDIQNLSDRRASRIEQEDMAFNPEHYLADLFQTDNIDPLITFQLSALAKKDYSWNETEEEILKNLPNKEFLLDHEALQSTYLGLVDILLAYAYEYRTTMEDLTVESARTISKLSGTLSWLEVFNNIHQVVKCFLRRSLCFPLYRNFELTQQVIKDVVSILEGGKMSILQSLLRVYHLFHKSDTRYILNQLYIRDYCVWIQTANEENLKSLASGLASIRLKKEDAGFDLLGLEEVGKKLLCESDSSDESDDLENQMKKMSLDKEAKLESDSPTIPMDLRVAAEAAYMSSSDSELDSDDLSSAESDCN